MAPWWWFPCKPKHVGAVLLILKCFNNSTFFNVVCISWKLKWWILFDARCNHEVYHMVRLCFQRRLRVNLTDDKQYTDTWWCHDKLLQIKTDLHNPQFNEIQYNNLQSYAKCSPGEKRGVMPTLVRRGKPPLVNTPPPTKKKSVFTPELKKIEGLGVA